MLPLKRFMGLAPSSWNEQSNHLLELQFLERSAVEDSLTAKSVTPMQSKLCAGVRGDGLRLQVCSLTTLCIHVFS